MMPVWHNDKWVWKICRGAAFGHKSGVSNPSVKCDKQGGSNLRTACGLGEESWGGSKGIWFRMAGCPWWQNTKHLWKSLCVWIGCGLEEEELLEICCHLEVCCKKNLLQFGGVWFGGDKGSIAKLMVFFFGGCLCVKLVGKRLKKCKTGGKTCVHVKFLCVFLCFFYVCTPDFKRSSSLGLFAKWIPKPRTLWFWKFWKTHNWRL